MHVPFLPAWSRRALGASALLLTLGAFAGCTKESSNPTYAQPVVTDNANSAAKEFADYTDLKWSDEFDGGSLDQSKWAYEVQDVWYNNELQATTNSVNNLFLDQGKLVIQARKESYNGREYTSARIVTRDKKSFGFGRIDVRAKLPKGKGVWPAIWMLGTNEATAPWPACGEIDIMELRGSTPNLNFSTVHFGENYDARREKGTTYALPSGDFSTDFHTFTMIRAKNQMRWYVDGVKYFTVTPADATPYPFNNPFYMILNVAVGGIFDGNPDGSTVFPVQMQVDYVKFFQYPE